MKYLIFLNHGKNDSWASDMHMATTLLKAYAFKKPIVIAGIAAPVTKSAKLVAEMLECPLESTFYGTFSEYKNRGKEAQSVLSYLQARQEEEKADAVIYMGKGYELYYTAREAIQKLSLDSSLSDTLQYFNAGDITIIDLEQNNYRFFKNAIADK